MFSHSTGWNNKIVILKKTRLQLYLNIFIEKSIQVDYVVELTSIQGSRLQPQSPPRYGSGTGSMSFLQAPVGARQILGGYSVDGGNQAGFGVVGGHVGDVLDV